MRKISILLFSLCFLFSGCSSELENGIVNSAGLERIIDSGTSYFDQYRAEGLKDNYEVQGTVYQMENDENAVIAEVLAEKETSLKVSGKMERMQGDVSLVYTSPDGNDIFIADSDSKEIETEIDLPKGKGIIHFSGNGKKAVCRFEFHFGGESVKIVDGTEPLQKIEDVENISFPGVNDNWPECFNLSNDGLYADGMTSVIEIEEPMELVISCVTESGRLDISIVDDSQNVCFDQSDIVTGEYTADIRAAGTYTIILKADYHVGSLTIKPAKEDHV